MKNTDNTSMKTLTLIHKILKIYDDCMDCDKLDLQKLNPTALKVSKNRFVKVMKMLIDNDYIEGAEFDEWVDGNVELLYEDSRITLEGLKFYAENASLLNKLGFLPDLISGGITIAASAI